jgi:hypothetical protein
MAPRALGRPIWSRCGLVHWIGPTVPANSAYGGQALLKCCEPAIRGAALCIIVIGAPRTIGRGGFLKADHSHKHTKDDQKNPHRNLLVFPVTSNYRCNQRYFIPRIRDEARRLQPISPSYRSFCTSRGRIWHDAVSRCAFEAQFRFLLDPTSVSATTLRPD